MPMMKGCTSGFGGQQNLQRVCALRDVPSLSVKWYRGLMAVPWVITVNAHTQSIKFFFVLELPHLQIST